MTCRTCGAAISCKGHYRVYCDKSCQIKFFNDKKTKAQQRMYYKNGERNRQYLYGCSKEKYESLLAAQHGLCAVCKLPLDIWTAIDHDHACCPGRKSCGKCIRGLLHRQCNAALGAFKDSPETCRNAALYLERNRHES